MNSAIYDNRGCKIAGESSMPAELPERIAFTELPCYMDGIMYFEQDDGCIGAVTMDAAAARQVIDSEQVLAHPSRERLFRTALYGSLELKDISALSKRLHVRPDERRTVICVMPETSVDQNMLNVLRQIFEPEDSVIVEMNDGEIDIVCASITDNDMPETAQAIRETFISELATDAHIGIGEPAGSFISLASSRSTALQAVAIGRRLSYQGGTWQYGRMLPEMLLAGINEETVKAHSSLIMRIRHTIDEETEELLDELFKQNLNISQTAKELFMHRNTLIYRLDKIRKSTGLDATHFDDAVTLRIILALARLNYKE